MISESFIHPFPIVFRSRFLVSDQCWSCFHQRSSLCAAEFRSFIPLVLAFVRFRSELIAHSQSWLFLLDQSWSVVLSSFLLDQSWSVLELASFAVSWFVSSGSELILLSLLVNGSVSSRPFIITTYRSWRYHLCLIQWLLLILCNWPPESYFTYCSWRSFSELITMVVGFKTSSTPSVTLLFSVASSLILLCGSHIWRDVVCADVVYILGTRHGLQELDRLLQEMEIKSAGLHSTSLRLFSELEEDFYTDFSLLELEVDLSLTLSLCAHVLHPLCSFARVLLMRMTVFKLLLGQVLMAIVSISSPQFVILIAAVCCPRIYWNLRKCLLSSTWDRVIHILL